MYAKEIYLLHKVASKQVLPFINKCLFLVCCSYSVMSILITLQGLLVLDCLRNYKRVSAPSDFEKQWYSDHHIMVFVIIL